MIKTLRNLFLVLCLITFVSSFSYGQTLARTVVDAAGETFTQQNVSITYALGEAVSDVLSNTTINKYLTVGFIQPDIEISQVINNTAKALAVFPNPTNGGTVKLAFNHVPDGIYSVNVYDANGKLMQTQQVNYSSTTFYYLPLDVSHYAGGTYFIQVVNPSRFQGEVKLIKY